MSRRSTRLVPGPQFQQPDDDAASTSSTGSASQVSYRESPVRVFKKKTGVRRSGTRSSEVTVRDSLSQYKDYDEPAVEDDWEVEQKATPPRKPISSFRNFSAEPQLSARGSPALVSSLQEVQGHSSGYSSSEEGYYRPGLKSAQYPTEPEFGVKDFICSPAQVMTMLFWRLGSAWYTLTSGLSLLDVFLLSRRTAATRKAILIFLLLLFLAFSAWYWFPQLSSFVTPRAVKSEPSAPVPVSTVPQEVSVAPGLSALRDEINSRFVEREVRWTEERERAMRAEERWREQREKEQENMLRELSLLKQDGEKLKLLSETLTTEMRNLHQTVKSGDAEHRSRLGQETAGLDRQISDLRAELTSLHGATDLLRQRVDLQEASSAELKAELSTWLLENLASGAQSAGLVLQPELQGALEALEKKLLDRLAEDRVENRGDAWRSVGETLQGEGAGAVTVQDVHQIVDRALSLYRADGIGMVDYALESSGASVVNTRCSETYRTRSACLSLFGIPLWYHSESPRTVIQPEVYPGKCWAFRGGQGVVVISLSYPVHVTHVTLEHLPKMLSPTGRIDSAPKDFSVYGMSKEKDEGTLLGSFTYDQDGEPVQTFELPDSLEGVYRMVELRILSNWGHQEYTCVYRFRVHGQPWTTEE